VTVLRWKTMDRPRTSGPWVNGPVEVVLASEYDKLRAALEWLREWRMKDPESVDHAIAYALGEVDEEGNEINTPKPVDTQE